MQGRRDSALTPLGQVQASRQGAILRSLNVPPVAWVSPRARAQQTAALAGLSAQIDPDLAEISMGAWEGQLRPAQSAPGVLWKFAAPGGESQAALIDRLRGLLARNDSRPRVFVTHGVVSIGLRALLLGIADTEWDTMDDPQGVVHVLQDGAETLLT